MRILLFLIFVVLLWLFWPEQEPIPVEETFIGEQVKTLKEAEQFKDDYGEALGRHRDEIDKQVDGG